MYKLQNILDLFVIVCETIFIILRKFNHSISGIVNYFCFVTILYASTQHLFFDRYLGLVFRKLLLIANLLKNIIDCEFTK